MLDQRAASPWVGRSAEKEPVHACVGVAGFVAVPSGARPGLARGVRPRGPVRARGLWRQIRLQGETKSPPPDGSFLMQPGDDAASDAGDDAPSGSDYPATHPAMPTVADFRRGPARPTPRFIPVFFPNDAMQSTIEDFLTKLAASTYWTGQPRGVRGERGDGRAGGRPAGQSAHEPGRRLGHRLVGRAGDRGGHPAHLRAGQSLRPVHPRRHDGHVAGRRELQHLRRLPQRDEPPVGGPCPTRSSPAARCTAASRGSTSSRARPRTSSSRA